MCFSILILEYSTKYILKIVVSNHQFSYRCSYQTSRISSYACYRSLYWFFSTNIAVSAISDKLFHFSGCYITLLDSNVRFEYSYFIRKPFRWQTLRELQKKYISKTSVFTSDLIFSLAYTLIILIYYYSYCIVIIAIIINNTSQNTKQLLTLQS